jgi:hypothetical protein
MLNGLARFWTAVNLKGKNKFINDATIVENRINNIINMIRVTVDVQP